MQWGHQIEWLEGVRNDMGIMPLALLNRPELDDLVISLDTAFNTLSSSRSYGMGGPLPISIADMAAYCQLFEIRGVEERATFVTFMQRLDAAYLEVVAKRTATSTSSVVVNDGPALDNSGKR